MIELYKKRTETPLEALNRLRVEKPELINETLSYAGRLDPMAEGILPVLVGEQENKDRELYLKKDKEYYVEFLLGFSTDTGDVLGLLTNVDIKEVNESKTKDSLQNLKNITEQIYPWYSSKTVEGIPLFEYARKGDFSVQRPVKDISIYSVDSEGFKQKDSKEVLDSIVSDINLVQGDFRQKESVQLWKSVQDKFPEKLTLISCNIRVSSGTYIRGLTEILSKDLNTPVVVYKLVRTKIL